jgi:Zn-dependent protease
MAQLVRGGVRLGRILGVDIFLHWSWLLVALVEIETRRNRYSTQLWNVAEYLTFFAIVLAHELGHALACRSVGGRAEQIVLWPLGGVAYVQPPARPGAVLWSIAAGPLVNLGLLILSAPIVVFARATLPPDPAHFAIMFAVANFLLLGFNLLPIYPLDGGQIVQALLWFFVGRARSLAVVSVIGLAAAAAILPIALLKGSVWYAVLAVYAGSRALTGLRSARLMGQMAAAPRRAGFACPRCRAAPPVGSFWRCACGTMFDTFETGGRCPQCARTYQGTACNECGQMSAHAAFVASGP